MQRGRCERNEQACACMRSSTLSWHTPRPVSSRHRPHSVRELLDSYIATHSTAFAHGAPSGETFTTDDPIAARAGHTLATRSLRPFTRALVFSPRSLPCLSIRLGAHGLLLCHRQNRRTQKTLICSYHSEATQRPFRTPPFFVAVRRTAPLSHRWRARFSCPCSRTSRQPDRRVPRVSHHCRGGRPSALCARRVLPGSSCARTLAASGRGFCGIARGSRGARLLPIARNPERSR